MKLPWYKRFAEKCRAKGTNRIILDRESKDPYLERFYLLPRWVTLGIARVVIHRFWKGDTDCAWHDHPWPWASYILEGGYWEHRPNKKGGVDVRKWREPGSWAVRKATDLHYIEMDPKHKEVWTMFIMLTPALRKWGFRSFDWKTWTFHEDFLSDKAKQAKADEEFLKNWDTMPPVGKEFGSVDWLELWDNPKPKKKKSVTKKKPTKKKKAS